ncbi:MAG: 3-phosphoshikimate 1-carboxyvinyltransferase [Deltaproteobacteria bacterium]|nr:3-phosphoshikimate 1-carboxyvinyltransferase [Deltaproteobacteria bacterium]
MSAALPDPLPIRPRGPLAATVRPPGSRSLANRAQLAAALARGTSVVRNLTPSDDVDAMRLGLEALGVRMERIGGADDWRIHGVDGRFAPIASAIDVRASGTTARFLTAAATLASAPVMLDGTKRMRERPIADLAAALGALGARVEVLGERGCPPVRAGGSRLVGGEALLDVRRSSSQYVSGILLAAPYAERDVTLRLAGDEVTSRPFVDMTLAVMRDFGADVEWRGPGTLFVRAGRGYRAREYFVEPDAQGAVYGFAAAAIVGGHVTVEHIARDSTQGELAFLGALEAMGCAVERSDHAITVRSAPKLRGIRVDANAWSDSALALAVVALFADGPTEIVNVPNLRIKETDRLAALERELAKLGARTSTGADWLRIEPGPARSAEIDTYDDHRMAMSFALAGLRIPGVAIRDPGCVSKTWPGFFEALASWA